MQILPTYITVRSDDILERAIASEVSAEDPELTEECLEKLTAQYAEKNKEKEE